MTPLERSKLTNVEITSADVSKSKSRDVYKYIAGFRLFRLKVPPNCRSLYCTIWVSKSGRLMRLTATSLSVQGYTFQLMHLKNCSFIVHCKNQLVIFLIKEVIERVVT